MDKEPKTSIQELCRVINLVECSDNQEYSKNRALWYFLHFFFQNLEPEGIFFQAPGSSSRHHAYPGGLAYHTIHAANLGREIALNYLKRGVRVDIPIIIAGILLHDIGKIRAYKFEEKKENEKWKITKTDDENLHHHIPIGFLIVSNSIDEYNKTSNGLAWPISNEVKNHLLHVILAHHGRRSWSSPVTPKTIEAYIVHIVEFMDGVIDKFNSGEIPESLYDH